VHLESLLLASLGDLDFLLEPIEMIQRLQRRFKFELCIVLPSLKGHYFENSVRRDELVPQSIEGQQYFGVFQHSVKIRCSLKPRIREKLKQLCEYLKKFKCYSLKCEPRVL
jgi:hypothetical protein